MRFKKIQQIVMLIFILTGSSAGQDLSLGDARGLFFSIGVGPKIPIGDYSATNGLGIGVDVTFSYADNQILPLFFYTKLGYQHYPASNNLIKKSEYASYMTNEYLILPGIRYYFAPMIEDEILLMPIIELGPSIGIFNNSHIFQTESGRDDFDETLTKFGFHVGGGFSMFLMEATLNYFYFTDNHSLSLDLRIQIPIYGKF